LTKWIQNQEPSKSPDEIGVIQLAWLGDSVWELHQRLKHIHMPFKSKDLHLIVVKEVQANAQAHSLKLIEPLLKNSELDLIRRARNKTKRCPRSLEPSVYAQATGFETLIGWLFLKNPKRLSKILEYLDMQKQTKG
tara:strand:- start:7778 stop:8185 length:408 start_codon:yes stop_codon:yes gene_type:complete